jgi:NodT family efflux transporter outer membrane factor (OMF) lipoprotein
MTSLHRFLVGSASASFLFLAGCAVGPDFKEPASPSPVEASPVSDTMAAPGVVGGQAQQVSPNLDLPAAWWELFRSPTLNQLVTLSLTNNPGLKSAQAALISAHETTLAQKGAYWPDLSAGFSASRQKTSSQISPTPNTGALYFNLLTPQVNVSYVPDVFGLNRRSVEALQAQEAQLKFAVVATRISLTANVALAAIQEASLRTQIEATRELIIINSNWVQAVRAQLAAGYASQLDLAAQESQLAQTAAALPPLLKQLAQQHDALAILVGVLPDQPLPEVSSLAEFELPTALPASLPAQLVAHRPDVRQAAENLHAACAQVGIAVANRLPNVTLTADAGSMALTAGQMFAGGTGFWTLAGNVSQPIFQGGALLHRERAARAAMTAAEDQYQGTVLSAFQNVADTLRALQQDAVSLQAAAAAQSAAQTSLELTRRQLQTGYASYPALLNAEQNYQQSIVNVVQAQASRYADTAALFLALGGGWWNEPAPAPSKAALAGK